MLILYNGLHMVTEKKNRQKSKCEQLPQFYGKAADANSVIGCGKEPE